MHSSISIVGNVDSEFLYKLMSTSNLEAVSPFSPNFFFSESDIGTAGRVGNCLDQNCEYCLTISKIDLTFNWPS
jgi:hypothetical protein